MSSSSQLKDFVKDLLKVIGVKTWSDWQRKKEEEPEILKNIYKLAEKHKKGAWDSLEDAKAVIRSAIQNITGRTQYRKARKARNDERIRLQNMRQQYIENIRRIDLEIEQLAE